MTCNALAMLALTLYFESRSEGLQGLFYTADVVLNRVESNKFPNTVCGVVEQPHQFSYYWDGKPETIYDMKAWEEAMWVSKMMLSKRIHFIDSCHYHADYVNPDWSSMFTEEVREGRHVFYKGGC